MPKIDDFKEYARRRIVDRLREKKNEEENKVEKIRSYDGEDAVYEGSDKEYKDFLESLDIETEQEAEPVDNTQRIDLNVKEMLNKVKEKAGSIAEAAAVKIRAEKTSDEAVKNNSYNDETCFEKLDDDITSDLNEMQTAITDTVNEKIDGVSEEFAVVNNKLERIREAVTAVENRMQTLEIKNEEMKSETEIDLNSLKQAVGELKATTEQIRDAVNGVAKLNDSVFDMKNSQQNTKNALNELQIEFNRLKKKVVAGVAVLSVIGFITIVLEVINLLA